ncbi:MAG: GNAT family N-acetyltransferase [Lachnospiraceae bacterium]|nr:GNAT family N-acetyltransferase [Lachnospiraceae bacterium]
MVHLKKLNEDNWLEVSNLSVTQEQKEVFPIPNVYWLGISRYEEHTTLFAIMLDDSNIGLIGMGYDEDGVSGFLNPLMIDERYQGKGYAKEAMRLAVDYLKTELGVSEIHIGHRKSNVAAGKLYESMGFAIVGEDEQDYFRCLSL